MHLRFRLLWAILFLSGSLLLVAQQREVPTGHEPPSCKIADVTRGNDLPSSIGPGKSQALAVTISGLKEGEYYKLRVDSGGDAQAGSASISAPQDGKMSSSGTVTIAGGAQTEPGHIRLKIVAELNGDANQGKSETKTFAVCAHPVSISFASPKLINGPIWGVRYRGGYKGDSGDNPCDKVSVQEIVSSSDPSHSNPGFTSITGLIDNNGFDWKSEADAVQEIDTQGRRDVQVTQYFKFSCARCGIPSDSSAPSAPNSGFALTYEAYKEIVGSITQYVVAITRKGAPVEDVAAGGADGIRTTNVVALRK